MIPSNEFGVICIDDDGRPYVEGHGFFKDKAEAQKFAELILATIGVDKDQQIAALEAEVRLHIANHKAADEQISTLTQDRDEWQRCHAECERQYQQAMTRVGELTQENVGLRERVEKLEDIIERARNCVPHLVSFEMGEDMREALQPQPPAASQEETQ